MAAFSGFSYFTVRELMTGCIRDLLHVYRAGSNMSNKFCVPLVHMDSEVVFAFLPPLQIARNGLINTDHCLSRSSRHEQLHRIVPRRTSNRCRIVAVNGRGFGGFLSKNAASTNEKDALPSPEAKCACGSEKSYGKCCRPFHTTQSTPQLAEELLRSRYSAYAYRLPSYIMKTTHKSSAELDRRKWKREILDFCMEYQFVGGVDIIETQITGPQVTRILFRANLMQRTAPIAFLEMSTFVRERNVWFYKNGKLVDIDDQS